MDAGSVVNLAMRHTRVYRDTERRKETQRRAGTKMERETHAHPLDIIDSTSVLGLFQESEQGFLFVFCVYSAGTSARVC